MPLTHPTASAASERAAPQPKMNEWSPYPTGAPHTVCGDVRWRRFFSPQLRSGRDVIVYLPPGHDAGRRRYPVVYMQDAQNLFDAATSYAGVEWQADETMQALADEGLPAIVVGVNHAGPERVQEYTPFAWLEGKGEAYLRFLSDTLMPVVNADFRTMTGPEATVIAGSSMGGLISLYAFFRYPEIFGLAGVMSPSLWVGRFAILDYVRAAQRPAGRLYVDSGTREPTARPLVELLRQKGYGSGDDLLVVSERGAAHEEAAWARRLPGALRFLLRDHIAAKP